MRKGADKSDSPIKIMKTNILCRSVSYSFFFIYFIIAEFVVKQFIYFFRHFSVEIFPISNRHHLNESDIYFPFFAKSAREMQSSSQKGTQFTFTFRSGYFNADSMPSNAFLYHRPASSENNVFRQAYQCLY